MLKNTDLIIETITKYLPKTEDEWELVGFLNKKREIFAFGNDSKIIGRLFEVIAFDALNKTAQELGFELKESEKQTVYPDFYFIKQNNRKIAIDIKTTYRKSKRSKYNFTGGSFTSYMRNPTKNIAGNYSEYDAHYILGIVYDRETEPTIGKQTMSNLPSIIPAYKNIETFVQEKFRICGEKKGSGNTDNIGTIKANSTKPFIYGAGPFAWLGEEIFHDYWSNHPKYKDSEDTKESLFKDIPSYIEWKKKSDPKMGENIAERYKEYQLWISEKNKDNWV
ncbi:type II restriction endonuclease [Exiguobacterium sp. LL15]|uniref:type II restriction endonuclease n=1 Tax=Exiguobacterium sp. LL15 TaxID=2950547 RepID=UPI00210A3A17|nr:type II restriction endonuclease [Exiguobacterium sp. LL15]MCQ4091531.1 restriction endonuclease [Exiguobacterium sp. LL15]